MNTEIQLKTKLRKVFVNTQVYCSICFTYFMFSGIEQRMISKFTLIYHVWFYFVISSILVSLFGLFYTGRIKVKPNYLNVFLLIILTILIFEVLLIN